MKKYVISAVDTYFSPAKTFETDNPSTALSKWVSYAKKYPGNTAILCGDIEDVLVLYKEFYDNMMKYKEVWVKEGVPYNFDYILDWAFNSLSRGWVPGFSPYKGYYDQVPCFSYG